MKQALLSSLFLLVCTFGISAQGKYKSMKTVEGVEFSIKWASEKWYKPKGDKILLVRIANTNSQPISYTLGVDVSRNGVMLESSEEMERCLKGKEVAKGRLNGVIYSMKALSQDDINNQNFDLELTGLEVKVIDICDANQKAANSK